MIRKFQPNGIRNCIQYTGSNPKSVVIALAGKGEISNDVTIIEHNIKFFAALASLALDLPDRIILGVNVPAGQDGYYANTMDPIMNYASSLKLPPDGSGLSLGGMGMGLNVPRYNFRSVMTCPGKVYPNVAAGPIVNGQPQWPAVDYVAAYRKIPSIHYYDPADTTIQDGYRSTKALVDQLQAEGKKDITLIELPGKGHDVWDYAYSPENYFAWLAALDAGGQPVPQPQPTPVPHIFVNDIDTGIPGPLTSLTIKLP